MSLPSFVDARKLLSDPHASLTLQNLVLHVVLHAKFVGNKDEGIAEFLDWKMGIYNVQFDGVLVAYSNVKTVDSKGKIITDKPYIHYDITGDFIIFRPTVGSIIRGSLNTVNTSDYLSCVVHKSFNVSIPLNHVIVQHELKVEDKILFVVKNILNHKGILSMIGTLSNDSFSLLKNTNQKRKRTDSLSLKLNFNDSSMSTPMPAKKIKLEKDAEHPTTTFNLKQYMSPDEDEEEEDTKEDTKATTDVSTPSPKKSKKSKKEASVEFTPEMKKIKKTKKYPTTPHPDSNLPDGVTIKKEKVEEDSETGVTSTLKKKKSKKSRTSSPSGNDSTIVGREIKTEKDDDTFTTPTKKKKSGKKSKKSKKDKPEEEEAL